ncbi:MAG TPA: methyltransferase domain-containing protein [Rhizomicrobium sp.]|jgi:S-adenosylmethionine-diacylgycerolhomoserine-N-methlytransferase
MSSEPDTHAALMDRVYRRQRHIYNLTRRYYLVGRDRLIRGLGLKPGDRCVEIGCGTARNLIAVAHRYPQARLFGLDASQAMLETATHAVERAGLSSKVKLVHGYAENLDPALFEEAQPFECAVFSYSLSMIPDWQGALAAANAALSPSGRLHIVDFGDLTGLGRIGSVALRFWLGRFHVVPRAEILHELESRDSSDPARHLWISPGRYAFVWSGQRDGLREAG